MGINIQTNVSSLEAQRNTTKNQNALMKSFARLSSGFRVNSAADDAAGLGISEGMKAQIRSYAVAERNANDAVSMTQTAEASLGEMHDILGRMRELAMQAANGSMGTSDRGYIDTEFSQLKDELTRIQGSTKFNGNLLVATTVTSVTFQVGLNNEANDQITVNFGGLSLGSVLTANVTTASGALDALAYIDTGIASVSTSRASFGSVMNRMDVTMASIQTMRINLSAANSRIRDVDVADETSKLSRNQVLTQAGVSILAQANQLPQSALNLLGGR